MRRAGTSLAVLADREADENTNGVPVETPDPAEFQPPLDTTAPPPSMPISTTFEQQTVLSKLHHVRAVFEYKFDAVLCTVRGQVILLILTGVVLDLTMSPIAIFMSPMQYIDAMYQTLLDIVDPKSSSDGDAVRPAELIVWTNRFLGLIEFITGFIYLNVIVGFVVDLILSKMDALKEGKMVIVESNHTLVLGWNDMCLSFLHQICLANSSEGGGVVVILCDRPRHDVEREIQDALPDTLKTQIVVSTGNPLMAADLNRVSASLARSITVMATNAKTDVSDAAVLRTLLTIQSLRDGVRGHVVVDVGDPDNNTLLKVVSATSDIAVETIVTHQILGRLIVMCSRSPSLANVYSELLGFDGNEFYAQSWPDLEGLTFGELPDRFADAIPIGIRASTGKVYLRPSRSRRVELGDEIIVLAEDNDTYKPSKTSLATYNPMVLLTKAPVKPAPPTRIMLCGWRRELRDILRLLDGISSPNTEVHLVNATPVAKRLADLRDEGLNVDELRRIKLTHTVANTAAKRHIEDLVIRSFHCMLVLSDGDREDDSLCSDSHVLATVLRLRAVELSQYAHMPLQRLSLTSVDRTTSSKKPPAKAVPPNRRTHCVAEILDTRTQKTLRDNTSLAHNADFIPSNDFISRMLAMVSESRWVANILDELLGDHGVSLDVVPATRYATFGELVSFAELAHRAGTVYGDIVCGFVHKQTLAVTLNPPNKQHIESWDDNRDMIVLREAVQQPKLLGQVTATRLQRQAVRAFNAKDAHLFSDPHLLELAKKRAAALADIEQATPDDNWPSDEEDNDVTIVENIEFNKPKARRKRPKSPKHPDWSWDVQQLPSAISKHEDERCRHDQVQSFTPSVQAALKSGLDDVSCLLGELMDLHPRPTKALATS
ncbi:hypothetical protein H310_02642 [Aphanomyces invadans]|uniref:RCK N-terminal domain-containing protein n=1 Tax=Aphanomyces invadans TaxID=157072 RepID=A0A024UJ93_9STRA|nr:hypothetical protein H310_02642 [Aphanomyces invadans]ETW06364.1 hypothetical protein H310_02642 [Aphanomyces invadans]|eukprot:XP_008864439.1 hypothetical protein H310_02642 [Aphanomyces invadans]